MPALTKVWTHECCEVCSGWFCPCVVGASAVGRSGCICRLEVLEDSLLVDPFNSSLRLVISAAAAWNLASKEAPGMGTSFSTSSPSASTQCNVGLRLNRGHVLHGETMYQKRKKNNHHPGPTSANTSPKPMPRCKTSPEYELLKRFNTVIEKWWECWNWGFIEIFQHSCWNKFQHRFDQISTKSCWNGVLKFTLTCGQSMLHAKNFVQVSRWLGF